MGKKEKNSHKQSNPQLNREPIEAEGARVKETQPIAKISKKSDEN